MKVRNVIIRTLEICGNAGQDKWGFIEFFVFKQKTAYEIYQCDWSSDVCSSDLSVVWKGSNNSSIRFSSIP